MLDLARDLLELGADVARGIAARAARARAVIAEARARVAARRKRRVEVKPIGRPRRRLEDRP